MCCIPAFAVDIVFVRVVSWHLPLPLPMLPPPQSRGCLAYWGLMRLPYWHFELLEMLSLGWVFVRSPVNSKAIEIHHINRNNICSYSSNELHGADWFWRSRCSSSGHKISPPLASGMLSYRQMVATGVHSETSRPTTTHSVSLKFILILSCLHLIILNGLLVLLCLVLSCIRLQERDHLEDLGAGEMIILNCTLKKQDGMRVLD